MMRRRGRHGGFMLVEVLVVISLLAFVAVLMTQVVVWTMRVMREAEHQHTQLSAFDDMMRQLRSDTWVSAELRAEADGVRMLGGVGQVRWLAEQEAVVRISESGRREWSVGGIALAVEGASVVVRSGDEDGMTVWAASEMILLEHHERRMVNDK